MYRRLRKQIVAVAQRSGRHREHGLYGCGLRTAGSARSGHALATRAISQAPRIPYHQTSSPLLSSSSTMSIFQSGAQGGGHTGGDLLHRQAGAAAVDDQSSKDGGVEIYS